ATCGWTTTVMSPATMSQVGETYTGMPNGRPIRMPGDPLPAVLMPCFPSLGPRCYARRGEISVRSEGPGRATRPHAIVGPVAYSSAMTLPEERTIIGALSPSRAGDFMTCPLLYRFRVIDQLPERPAPAAVRGTLVHAVLERLYDLPAAGRTPAAARELLLPEWRRLLEEGPAYAGLFADDAEREAWLEQAAAMLDRYFRMEDPRRLEPAQRELYVEAVLDSGLLLRGYIDRLDVAPNGDIRVVDYK